MYTVYPISDSNGRLRRISMEQMDILKLTPDSKVAKVYILQHIVYNILFLNETVSLK